MSWSQINDQMEGLEKDVEAMDRVKEVLPRYEYQPGFQFEQVRRQIVRDLEAAKEKARWYGIRSEIDNFAKLLAIDPTPDYFTIKPGVVSTLVQYIRHLEEKAGITNDRA